MRIVIIGGTGHIGTYLVPELVKSGHEIVCVTRQQRQPYQQDPGWAQVQMISLDRDALQTAGSFGRAIADLHPDIVIDLICFTLPSARQLVEALRGKIKQFLHCGTIWVHGHSVQVPTTEDQPRNPFGDYGIAKAEIEKYLLNEFRSNGFPATILHPGHIVGPGWLPVNPAGNKNPAVFDALKHRKEVFLPNLGMETLHHVHAADVAQAFVKSIEFSNKSIGENFHVVSPQALTLRGYAESMAEWFGQPANLKFLPWEEWKQRYSETDASLTLDHIAHSPNCSIDKARRLIEYQPAYSSLQALRESLGSANQ